MNRITEADVEKETVVQTPPKRGRLVKAADAKKRSAPADEIPPALRTMLVSIRAGLLQAADAIADYLRLEKRPPRFRLNAARVVIRSPVERSIGLPRARRGRPPFKLSREEVC